MMIRDETHVDWKPIATAPELERIFVPGWQKPSGGTVGYRWYHEDCADEGKAIEHPDADLWHPIILAPLPPQATP